MSFINKLEPKFGRYAFPGLVQTIAIFWVLTFVLQQFNPELYAALLFDVGQILKGQIWRIFSFLLIPPIPPGASPIYLFFAVYFNFFLGQLLDNAWGAFRVNIYILSGLLVILIYGVILHFTASPLSAILPFFSTMAFMGSIFLSCACIYPDLEIRIMLIIPIKMKWLGLIAGGGLLVLAIQAFSMAIAVIVGLIPFLAVFAPKYVNYSKNRAFALERKKKFDSQVRPAESSLHHCAICHKTEHEEPDLDFRVSGGEEYCVPCLEEKKKAEAGNA